MNSRFLGGILLIIGTSIGAGMLALPVANAGTGFWASSLYLLLCWGAMTLGAFFILEANLYLPMGSHMVSMAEATLGKIGLLTAWLSYIFLLYALLSAYISGGADVFGALFSHAGIPLRPWQASILFTVLFGTVVYGGIRRVDLLNRCLMFGKLAAYAILVVLIAPHMQANPFETGHYLAIHSTVMILITAFGFAIIVPNLRDYFNDDLPSLKRVIFWGSLIPLVCYIAWDAVIIGTLPSQGAQGLNALLKSPKTTSELASLLSNTLHRPLITSLFNVFTSICMLTAFLGVALCLMSFLADGFKMQQHGREGRALFILTFFPPLLIVLFYPGAYIFALGYAGVCCVILLMLLPALMVLAGRKRFSPRYQVFGGRITPWVLVFFALVLLVNAVCAMVFY